MQRVIRFFKNLFQSRGRVLVIGAGCLLGFAALLLSRLGSLTTNLGTDERTQQLFSSSWRHITNDPLNLPYTATQWAILHLFSHQGVTVTRLASALFGALTLIAFAYVVRRWYGVRTAIFGFILFATSSWFLHVSRFGGTGVMYLWAVPTLLAVQIAWERHAKRSWISWVAVAIIGLLLYVPGMVWLIIVGFALHPAQLLRSWQHTRKWWQWAVLALVSILFVAPLVAAFIRQPALVQAWIGLPTHFASLGHIGRQLAHSVSFLAYRGPSDPQRWLDRLPVLDIFSLAMFALGLYFYVRHALAPRTRQLVGLWVIGAVLFAIGGPVSYSLLVPVAYLIVVGGIGFLLHEWLHVFPKNALARSIGYGFMGLVVAAACVYNLRSYFVAWPHAPSTISAYHIPRDK